MKNKTDNVAAVVALADRAAALSARVAAAALAARAAVNAEERTR